jgi:mono/diheme cytochrome c family protein
VIAVAVVGAVVAFVAVSGGDDALTTTQAAPTIPVAGDPVNGKVVFAATGCGGCHAFAPAGATGKTGPSLDATALTEAQLAAVIAAGRGAMPGYDRDLSAQEIADLAAYVRAGAS